MAAKVNIPAEYSEEETARRRDEVIRRMANTPPQPRKPKNHPRRGKKTSTADRKTVRDRGKS
jgi:hypothetical protein